jgi:hypothetical protein
MKKTGNFLAVFAKGLLLSVILMPGANVTLARDLGEHAAVATFDSQNAALKKNTEGKGFGPQSPRDLNVKKGLNKRLFAAAPSHKEMNLCNIHFHKNAEHRGGEFTSFAGYGDGNGNGTGFKFSGKLSAGESRPLDSEVCRSDHGGLNVGDTIEVHFVHSTAQVVPGPTLKSCLSDSDINPQLRVEAVVLVLVNDTKAFDFVQMTRLAEVKGYHQAINIPRNAGKSVRYAGSTTGPAYNEKGSPLQVSWSVRPGVLKVNAETVGQWCKSNVFGEDHPHGVRNLVSNQELLSQIK